jgi:hypothetical protein
MRGPDQQLLQRAASAEQTVALALWRGPSTAPRWVIKLQDWAARMSVA